MEEKKPIRIHSRLFVRIYLYYAIILVVMAVLLGVIFMQLNGHYTLNNYREQLQEKAISIAQRMELFLKDRNNDLPDTGNEVASFLSYLEDIEPNDIWIISNPNSDDPMEASMENITLDNNILTENIRLVLDNAFQSKSYYTMGYDKIFGTAMITVGVPIIGVQNKVSGAVLINSYQSYQQEMMHSSMFYVIVSGIVALVISFIIAIVFARSLSRPILKMRKTALKLADGQYEIKTGIVRGDEIGDLASSIDILSARLLVNEEERKNNDQMRSDFFANISHELRTPITVVRAYTETLIDGVVKDPEKIAGYYERMLSETKGMERLVGDLLLLSKMQNPDFAIEAEPINLVQVFDDILRSAAAVSREKKIHFDVSMERSIAMMFGDYDRLRQMFMIILDNAIKFSEENTTIHISMSHGDKLIVSIRDEGIGIAEEDLPYIFDKFYRSKLKVNAKGSGLGLAIAKQIAVKHGGDIEVSSRISEGTEFIFTFDILNEQEFI